MRNSTVLVGLIFGVFVAAALGPPLYVELPYRLLDDWYYVNGQAAMGGFVAAMVLPVVAGFLAAMLDSEAAVRSGTSAGFLAMMMGGLLVALPAAQVEGCDALLSALKNGDSHLEVLRAVTREATVYGTWLPVAMGLLLLGLGPALGAIGGVLFDLYAGATGRSNRTVHRSSAPIFGLAATLAGVVIATTWAVWLDLGVLPNLGAPVSWTERNLLASPLLVAALIDSLLVSWVFRDATLLWRSNLRAFALGWGGTALALAVAAPVVEVALYPQSAVTAVPWIAGGAIAVTALGALLGASRTEIVLEADARTLWEFLGHGVLCGTVVVGALFYVGFAPALGTYVVAFPYVRALLKGAEVVEAQPDLLVATVYKLHFAALAAIPLVTAAYVVAAGPFWLFVRAYSGRRD